MSTKSVSANVDPDVVEDFDEAWERVWNDWFEDRSYSRSQALEEAMRLSVSVLEAWETAQGEPPEDDHTLQLYTKDAIKKRVDYHDLTK